MPHHCRAEAGHSCSLLVPCLGPKSVFLPGVFEIVTQYSPGWPCDPSASAVISRWLLVLPTHSAPAVLSSFCSATQPGQPESQGRERKGFAAVEGTRDSIRTQSSRVKLGVQAFASGQTQLVGDAGMGRALPPGARTQTSEPQGSGTGLLWKKLSPSRHL